MPRSIKTNRTTKPSAKETPVLYVVLRSLQHDDLIYDKGEGIELVPSDAAHLLESKAIGVIVAAPVVVAKVVESEAAKA